MASTIQSVGASSDGATQSTSASTAATDQKNTFLKLLVAQIRNQNPLEPADGIQFVSQLAQFSQLEEVIGMRADIAAIRAALGTKPAADPKGA